MRFCYTCGMPTTQPRTATPTDFTAWLLRRAGARSLNDLHARTKASAPETNAASNLTAQLRKNPPVANSVVAVARAWNIPVMEALVASGVIKDEEVAEAAGARALSAASDEQVAMEVYRRLVDGRPHHVLEEPLDEIAYNSLRSVAYDPGHAPEDDLPHDR